MESAYQFRGIEVPQALRESIDRYVNQGIPTGGFLEACIKNDLKSAVSLADETSLTAIPAIVGYLYNECPMGCWGGPESFERWIALKRDAQKFHTGETA
jgi:hypothetical protein